MDPLELSRKQISELHAAHKQLDGTKEVTYKFNAKVRYNLARNLTILSEHVNAIHKAQRHVIEDSTPGSGRLEPGTKEYYALEGALGEFLDGKVTVDKLYRLSLSELQLDVNPIPVSALSWLDPIIVPDAT